MKFLPTTTKIAIAKYNGACSTKLIVSVKMVKKRQDFEPKITILMPISEKNILSKQINYEIHIKPSLKALIGDYDLKICYT